jgi:hypothetical protein
MRSRLVPLALLAALAVAALGPATAFAQFSNSTTYTRPSYYTPSNYGTPNASMYRPSNFGNPGISYSMPNPYRYMPSVGTLGPGTPTPIGLVRTLPGTLITGSNYGGAPAANQPLPADGGPITVNTAPSQAFLPGAINPAEQPAAPPTPENAAEAPAGAPATDESAAAAYGPLTGTYVPNALMTPSAGPLATTSPYAAPYRGAPLLSAAPATYVPSYGTFAPAPQYPASFSSALNRVYGSSRY